MFKDIEVGVNVTITNELVDKATMLGKLQEMLVLAVSNPGALNIDAQGIIDTIFDTMNIPTDRIYSSKIHQPSPDERTRIAQSKVQAAQSSQQMNAMTGAMTAPQPKSENQTQSPQALVRQNLTQLA